MNNQGYNKDCFFNDYSRDFRGYQILTAEVFMSNKIKVSVIIPVYNAEAYLEECLDSVIRQTLQGIEIICVDDGSTDGSRAILERYTIYNDNITCIFYDETRSASQARKDAVLASNGDFIMFLDADDFLEQNACEIAYEEIRKNNTDILQFDTYIENCANLPEERIKGNQKFLKPYTEKIIKNNLQTESFINKKFSFTLWNKIYYGEICRKAFSEITDGFFPKANDLYAAFYILKEAKSYSGISNKLYHYCFGRGMTGHDQMSIDDFRLCCFSTKVYKAIKNHEESAREINSIPICGIKNKIVEDVQPFETDFQDNYEEIDAVIENIKQRFHSEQLSKWNNNISDMDKREALAIYYKAWDEDSLETISALSKLFANKKPMISKYIDVFIKPERKHHKIKNLALYYRNIVNGGAQRVVAYLTTMFADMENGEKFNVVLLTDFEPNEEDYDLSPRVQRIVLPKYDSKTNYKERGQKLLDIIDKYDIDAFICSMWNGGSFLWDMLCIKNSIKSPALFSHIHSYFGVPWYGKENKIEEIFNSYAYIDGLITLSDYDRDFWKYCNKNVYKILNPCTESVQHKKNKWNQGSKSILWVGRISEEKQPLEVVRIMKYVVEKQPNYVCRILGDGENSNLKSKFEAMIDQEGLNNNIILEGFHKDVEPFYENSDVMISTSSIEGFPLSIMEAASYGLPTVIYDLPWLEYFKIIQGWEKVEQNAAKDAAEKILMLLSDKNKWIQKSESLYSSYNKYKEYDLQSQWLKVFEDYEKNISPELSINFQHKITYQQIINNHSKLISKFNEDVEKKNAEIRGKNDQIRQKDNKIKDLENKLNKIQDTSRQNKQRGEIILRKEHELSDVYNSESWRIGNFLITPFHWIKNIFKRK